MSTGIIILLVVIALLMAVVVAVVLALHSSKKARALHGRFGQESDRTAEE